MSGDAAAAGVELRRLDATETLDLGPGAAYRVVDGTVLVFAVSAGARRVRVLDAGPGELLAGVELPGDPAPHLIGVGLPGTTVAPTAPDPAALERMAADADAALRADEERAADASEALGLGTRYDERVIDDALLGLASVVPGRKPDALASANLPDDVAVVDHLARQIGLRPNPLRLRRAITDTEVSGRDPVTALAAAAGAAVRRVALTPDWWRREGPPLMLHRRDAEGVHAAAVWRRGAYRIWQAGDDHPAIDADSAEDWSREAILLEPLLDPNAPARLRDLLRLGMRGSTHSLWLVGALTAAVALLAAVIPIVAGTLTSTVALQTRSTLLVVGVALVAFAAGDMALRAVRSFALLRIRGRGTAVTATAVWDRLLRLPMTWHDKRTVADRVADANSIDTASMTLPDVIITSLLDISAVVGAVFGVMTASWPLALALLAFLAVRASVDMAVIRRVARLTARTLDAQTDSQGVTLGLLTGVNRLRVSGATGRAFALWARTQARATEVLVRQRRLTVLQQATGAMWPSVGLAVLLAVTALSGASVGQLVTAQTALTTATAATAAALAAVGAGLSSRAILERARNVLQAEPESGTGQEVAALAGGLDLRDIVFRYRDDLPPVLQGVNLSVPAGAHVAVVGPSGCGKSTLLRIVLGLADPESGIVSFDGRDLSALDRSSVRRQIGSVMQSSALMPGTIRDNVDLGRGLTPAEVWQALEDAAVAPDVRAMPMGLNSLVVEGGSTISGGQRQRILLARALAGRPRILILDEATSALDNVSQAAVVASLDRLQITRLVVAHRLSTIEQADHVVMLSDGVVVAAGTFDELLEQPGPFRELVQRQRI